MVTATMVSAEAKMAYAVNKWGQTGIVGTVAKVFSAQNFLPSQFFIACSTPGGGLEHSFLLRLLLSLVKVQ